MQKITEHRRSSSIIAFLHKRQIYTLIIAYLFTLAISLVQTAQAFSVFGYQLWGEKEAQNIKASDKAIAYKLSIFATDDHNNIIKKDKISTKDTISAISIVENSSNLFLDKETADASSVRLLTKAREDYQRILHAFYAEGCYGASISIRINGEEAANIPPETILPARSSIIIMVNPGPRYIFSRAVIHNYPNKDIDKSNFARKKLEKLAFATYNIAKSKFIFQAEEETIQKWRDLGYAKAKLAKQEIIADHASRTVSADIWIDPGPKTYYSKIILKNLSKHPTIKDDFILWVCGFKIGQIYNPIQIQEARERLAKLSIFQAQLITEEDIDNEGGLTLKIVVQERPLHRFSLGGTLSSLDGFGLTSYVMHRNLFGNAETLTANLDVSNLNGFNFDNFSAKNFLYTLGLTYTKPATFVPDNNFVMSIKHQQENLNLYRTNSLSFQTGFVYKIVPVLSGYTYFEISQINSTDPEEKRQHFFTTGLSNEFLYDNRDSTTNPSIGRYNETVIAPFYEGVYRRVMLKLTNEARHYFSFGIDNKLIIALRSKIGTILGGSQNSIPANYLFFSGGGSSIRGYRYHSIGVTSPNSSQTMGARSLIEASGELRMLPFRSVGFTTFLDTGLVSKDILPHNLKDVKVGLGVGAFYLTAVGPIRFDLAWPLNRGRRTVSFYIGIGQTF